VNETRESGASPRGAEASDLSWETNAETVTMTEQAPDKKMIEQKASKMVGARDYY